MGNRGIEPRFPGPKPEGLPLSYSAIFPQDETSGKPGQEVPIGKQMYHLV